MKPLPFGVFLKQQVSFQLNNDRNIGRFSKPGSAAVTGDIEQLPSLSIVNLHYNDDETNDENTEDLLLSGHQAFSNSLQLHGL